MGKKNWRHSSPQATIVPFLLLTQKKAPIPGHWTKVQYTDDRAQVINGAQAPFFTTQSQLLSMDEAAQRHETLSARPRSPRSALTDKMTRDLKYEVCPFLLE